MKRYLYLILAILVIVFNTYVQLGYALDVTPTDNNIIFEWEQLDSDLPYVSGFKLYWSDTETGTYIPVLDAQGQPLLFSYDSEDPNALACTPAEPCTSEQSFTVAGTPRRYKKYFKMTAVDKDGYESDFSNVAVGEDGTKEVWFINPLGRPFGVKVKIIRS